MMTRKVQRFDMIGAYIFANLVATAATTSPEMYGEALKQSVVYSPLLFAGFAMLTEPLTSAHAKWSRLVFGAIVASVSCLRGLQTGEGPRAVGESTTRSVVSSILLIILADAIIASVTYTLRQ